MKTTTLIPILGAALLLGCPAEEDPATTSPVQDDGDDTEDDDDDSQGEETETTNPSTTGDPSTSGSPTTNPATTDPSGTDSGETEDTEDTMDSMITESFLVPPDGGGPSVECSVWDQDCPDGQKCAPWANDGGNSWNATKCVPIDPMMNQPGDTCTVEGSGVSGIDSCDQSSMCWDVDGETNQGTCIAFCTGSEAAPLCDDPANSCSIANEGVLILCLPTCDPLLQDCSDGQACYPIDNAFVCAPDASGEMGADNDPCEFINACDAGLGCFTAAVQNGCASASCCTAFCDLDGADPCSAPEMCVPMFDMGNAPPGLENIGFCGIEA